MKRLHNPYKVHDTLVRRFRGVHVPELGSKIPSPFVSESLNAVSFVMGEIRSRAGGVPEFRFVGEGDIEGTGGFEGSRIVCAAGNVYLRPLVPIQETLL